MFYLSSPLISLGFQCSHSSLSNNEGVCSFCAFVTLQSPSVWPQVSSAEILWDAPLSLWAQQEMNNGDMQEICRRLSPSLSGAFRFSSSVSV